MQCAGLSKAAKNTPHSVNWVVIPKGYLHDRKYPCLGAIHINGKGKDALSAKTNSEKNATSIEVVPTTMATTWSKEMEGVVRGDNQGREQSDEDDVELHASTEVNHVDEEGGFGMFPTDSGFRLCQRGRICPNLKILCDRLRASIGSSIVQLIARLELYWDMKAVEHGEAVPGGFEIRSKFLGDGQTSEPMMVKLLRRKRLPYGIILVMVLVITESQPTAWAITRLIYKLRGFAGTAAPAITEPLDAQMTAIA
uniref:Reverse transcriptase domain-containing protein n=1 Tax=Angiostrongylus cantonensis TaxID=6313 RepID=A0A0K0CZ19_ANGCA